jgi:hypothetical protein
MSPVIYPFKCDDNGGARVERGGPLGLVSARWLALDSILRSLIVVSEGPELRAMMKRDLRLMEMTGRCNCSSADVTAACKEAADVMNEWRKTFS